jgi:hypothetical protein
MSRMVIPGCDAARWHGRRGSTRSDPLLLASSARHKILDPLRGRCRRAAWSGVDFLIEIVVEVVFELILEACGRGAARASKAVAREATGTGEPTRGWRVVGRGIPIAIGGGLGLWRGSLADGRLTWGWWLAVVIVAACTIGLVRADAVELEPPVDRWQRALRWWPRRRLAWFLAGNASFAIAYLVLR